MTFSVKAPMPARRGLQASTNADQRRMELRNRGRRRGRRLACETLEQRALLATISGTAFNDVNANGFQDSGETAMAGIPVYLDLNNNQTLDQSRGASTFHAAGTFPMPVADFSLSNPPAPTASTISVSGVGGIAHLTVNLSINHTWDSDLTATLTNPSGTTITLFSRVGANGRNFTDTTFDDQAAGPIGGGSAPFSGSFQPQQPLSTFSTQDANGLWTLKVSDGAAGDSGSLLGWSISITSYTEPERLTDAAGHYTFTNLPAGTYSVRQVVPAGYQVVAPVGGAFTSNLSASDSLTANFGDRLMPATLQGTAYLDANNNGVQDSNEPGQAHVTMYLDANNNGMLDAGEVSTVTDALGRYTFSNLAPSQVYTVREVAPAGSTPTGTPIQSVQVGTNIDLSPQAGSQTETSVAIDPTNTNNIFVVSNTTNGAGLFASSSHDGGLTWSAPQNIANGSDGLTAGSCDGSVSFDSYGNLFFTYIDSSISNIVVAMSADGGRTFTQLTRFTSPIDQPTITTGPNSVWVVYNHSGVPTVSHATVTGKGLGFVSAFSAPMSLSEPAGISGNFGDIAVGPEGQVAVAYQNANSNSGPDRIYLNVSTNGSTFGGYTLATSTNVGAFDRIPVQPTRSVDAEVSLGYDRSNGPHRGRLYMAYTDAPAPGSPDTNIFLRYSDDNGGSWSAPIKVNDDLTTNSQILPKLAVDPSTGNVAVSFYDARDSASNSSVAYYAAISLDGGQTFLLNKRLSAGMSTAPADSFNFGDYSGLAFSGGKLWAAWGDNSNSTGENDGSLDVMVNSAWVSSFDGFELRVSPGQTVSNLDFGNNRTVSPQFVVDDFLYPFSMTGPYWDRVPNASAYRGFEHLHTQGRAQIASNTVQWSLPRPTGDYEILVDWVASPTNAPDATYSIYDGPNLLTTVRVDQTARPSDASYGGILWQSLGTYHTSYSNLIVVLSSEASGNLSADAAMVCSPLSTSSPSKSMTASVSTLTKTVSAPSLSFSTLSANVSAAFVSTDLAPGSPKTFPDKVSASALEPSKVTPPPTVVPVSPSIPSYWLSPAAVSPAPKPVVRTVSTSLTPMAPVAPASLAVSVPIPDDAWFLDTFFARSSLLWLRPAWTA